jgi:hypothetical protein
VDPTTAAGPDPATQELLSAPAADRCADCEAPLATDQRYCLACGERRGKARFSFEALNRPPATAAPPQRRRLHISSSLSLILGVATLLLAMGVGVLIGHNSTTKSVPAASAPQTIKIEGGLGGGNSSGSGKSVKGSTASNAFKAPSVNLSPKVQKKVNAAASKVLGSGTKNLSQNPTQQVGGACSGGSGCHGGKFTGDYFPSGG